MFDKLKLFDKLKPEKLMCLKNLSFVLIDV